MGGLAGRSRAQPPSTFNPNGFTVTRAAGGLVGHRAHPVPDDDPAIGQLPVPAPAGGAQDRGARRPRHRHRRGDRRSAARCALGRIGGAVRVATSPARLAGAACPRPGAARRADRARRHGRIGQGWPQRPVMDYSRWGDVDVLAPHPADDDVLLGGVGPLRDLPDGVDAVVSLCRLGADEVPAPGVAASDHHEVWLIDSSDRGGQPEPRVRHRRRGPRGQAAARRGTPSAAALRPGAVADAGRRVRGTGRCWVWPRRTRPERCSPPWVHAPTRRLLRQA